MLVISICKDLRYIPIWFMRSFMMSIEAEACTIIGIPSEKQATRYLGSMPHHLHPRSGWTTSLFTTTLLVSFVVVAMPHVLPCPVEHRIYADGDLPREGRRRRRLQSSDERDGSVLTDRRIRVLEMKESEVQAVGERKRECPVPKPGGFVGEMLGLVVGKRASQETSDNSRSKE